MSDFNENMRIGFDSPDVKRNVQENLAEADIHQALQRAEQDPDQFHKDVAEVAAANDTLPERPGAERDGLNSELGMKFQYFADAVSEGQIETAKMILKEANEFAAKHNLVMAPAWKIFEDQLNSLNNKS